LLSLAALALAAVLTAALAPAHAGSAAPAPPSAPQQVVDVATLDDKARLHLLIGLAREGRAAEAQAILSAYPFSGPFAANRTLFVEGMILKANGDLEGAVAKYRAALASDPGLTLVRAELAHTLFLLEDDDAARFQYELLIGAAPTPELARTFNGFLDAIDDRRPWQFSVWASIAPSTNVNNGTSNDVIWIGGLPFKVDDGSREQSGIGVRGGADGSWSTPLGPGLTLVGAVGVTFADYEGDDFDDTLVSQIIELRRRKDGTEVWLGGLTQQRFLGGDELQLFAGLQATIKQRFTPRTGGYLRVRAGPTSYQEADYKNGWLAAAGGQVSWAWSPSTVFYALGGIDRNTAQFDHLASWTFGGGLAAYHEFSYGLSLYAEGRLRRAFYDGDYPFMDEPRDDLIFDGRATLTKRDWVFWGFAPQLEYTYSQAWSNTPFGDYDAHGASLTITRQF
jgi:tetratricopeptide (TPR) repeat protein